MSVFNIEQFNGKFPENEWEEPCHLKTRNKVYLNLQMSELEILTEAESNPEDSAKHEKYDVWNRTHRVKFQGSQFLLWSWVCFWYILD